MKNPWNPTLSFLSFIFFLGMLIFHILSDYSRVLLSTWWFRPVWNMHSPIWISAQGGFLIRMGHSDSHGCTVARNLWITKSEKGFPLLNLSIIASSSIATKRCFSPPQKRHNPYLKKKLNHQQSHWPTSTKILILSPKNLHFLDHHWQSLVQLSHTIPANG